MNKLKYVTLVCVSLLTMTSSVYANETKTSSVDISLDATVKDDKEVSDVLDSVEKELKDVSTVNVEYASKVQEHVELSEKIVTKTNEKSELQKTSKDLDAELEKLKAEVAQLEQAKADRDAEAKRKEQEAKLKEQEAKRKELESSPSPAQAPVASASYGGGQERAAFEKISAELGLSEADKAIWADIISKESGWSTTATNASSGAYGLGQALPAGKMAPYGSDYQTNPYTQLKWMYDYIVGRYGSMQGVGAFWASHHWY